jgi:hypothetical protein
MRRFRDRDGRVWDVVVGRESWGALLALFVPVDGDGVRQTMLNAAGYNEAHQELDALEPDAVQALLDRSVEKEGK